MNKFFGVAGVVVGLYVGISEGSSIGGIAVSAVTCGVIGLVVGWSLRLWLFRNTGV